MKRFTRLGVLKISVLSSPEKIRQQSKRSRTYHREAKSRVKEKKPPKAAINLGTDVDAPWGEKIETSRKENHQNA